MVRGIALLPHGTGKRLRVAVFAKDAEAEEARAAGEGGRGEEDGARLHGGPSAAEGQGRARVCAGACVACVRHACGVVQPCRACAPCARRACHHVCAGADIVGEEPLIAEIIEKGAAAVQFDRLVSGSGSRSSTSQHLTRIQPSSTQARPHNRDARAHTHMRAGGHSIVHEGAGARGQGAGANGPHAQPQGAWFWGGGGRARCTGALVRVRAWPLRASACGQLLCGKACARTRLHAHKWLKQMVSQQMVSQMGTLTTDVGRAVRELRAGRSEFRAARDGQLMAAVGKVGAVHVRALARAAWCLQRLLCAALAALAAAPRGAVFAPAPACSWFAGGLAGPLAAGGAEPASRAPPPPPPLPRLQASFPAASRAAC